MANQCSARVTSGGSIGSSLGHCARPSLWPAIFYPMLPTVFLSHGGGPSFFMEAKGDSMFAGIDKNSAAADNLRNLFTRLGLTSRPAFLLVVSAHWEEDTFAVLSGERPPLYFDYYGFPDFTYKLQWPAPGAPAVAARLAEFLAERGLKSSLDGARGYDHGVFVPLKLAVPDADIPVLQVSLLGSLDVSQHVRLGKVLHEFLASPEGQGGLLIGSGQMTHNLQDVRRSSSGSSEPAAWAKRFVTYFDELLTSAVLTAAERERRLLDCARAPDFAMAHPRIEHFLPLVVAATAAGLVPGEIIFSGYSGNMALHCFKFAPQAAA